MRWASGDARPRVAIVTCAQLPASDEDTRSVFDPLARRGVNITAMVWDDASVNWHAFDLAIVRSCWDYVSRRDEFLAWARRVPALYNPASVLAWNTDKRYLNDLASTGVPVVPTVWCEPDTPWVPPSFGDWVVKPAISIASLETGRYRLFDPEGRRQAAAHVARLQRSGRRVMIQPYLHGIDRLGETSLVYFAGAFSHAMRKAAVLDGPDTGLDRRFIPQGGLSLHRTYPTAAERALAERVLRLVPGECQRLLYARVDLIPGDDGEPRLLELELTEPQLYLSATPGAAETFADAIVGTLFALPATVTC
jgi:hypothetical protein